MKHALRRPMLNAVILTAGLVLALAMLPGEASACDVTIRIAPKTLNLRSSGTVVTVHTDIPYGDVQVSSVYLEDKLISSWKADDRGYFVAKFLMDDIKAIDGLALNEYNTLTFSAVLNIGVAVCGEADVMVIDRGPASPNRHGSHLEVAGGAGA